MGNTAEAGGTEFRYRGSRHGMPEKGPGSVPGVGRRLSGLLLDWLLSLAVVYGFLGADPALATGPTLVVFALMNVVLLTLFGTTIGKRMVGVGVAATGERALPWAVAMLVRTLLLCLVIPAVVYDRDQRGLHDRAAGTISSRF
ncbi:MAG: RDD family protein [Nocardiopsaceae bacterium]|nr:RDD family protein [Nocardiopsaceae bacterium]